MMKAVRVHNVGGPHVMKYETCPIPKLSKGKVLIKNTLAGVNYNDVYHRNGTYKSNLPFTLGRDGAGYVVGLSSDIDPKICGIKKDDRVVYGVENSGSYAEYTAVSIGNVVKIPEYISDEQAVTAIGQGLTTQCLTKGSYFVKKGDTVVIQTMAGGLGLWLCQVAKSFGTTVIVGTSNPSKEKYAKDLGADLVVLNTKQDLVEETMKFTNGKGADVVYDCIGKQTFSQSLKCVKKRGTLVLCGNLSGKVPSIDPLILTQQGSITFIQPKLVDYIDTRSEFLERVNDAFNWLHKGKVSVQVIAMPLHDAIQAHEKLEADQTIGKLVLVPTPAKEKSLE